MLQAETRTISIKYANNTGYIVLFMFVAIIGAFIWMVHSNEQHLKEHLQNPTRPQAGLQDLGDIQETLRKVSNALNKKTDVNKDGILNCIDAAVLFYQYFPDKSRVCIEVNRHPTNGWHHLFNCVNINGVWKAVEPQAAWKGYNYFWMQDCWGSTYDATYNRDATAEYKKYIK